MAIRRKNKLLIEPPPAATGDIAFNLIIFFLICASVQPEKGLHMQVPSSKTVKDKQQRPESTEIVLTSNTLTLNGEPVAMQNLASAVEAKLRGKTGDSNRVVILKTKDPDTRGERWAKVLAAVKAARGIVTIQIEEVQTRIVN